MSKTGIKYIPTIVMGLGPTGLYVIRELGREGIPIFGVSSVPQCGQRSKYLTHKTKYIEEKDDTKKLEKLCFMFKDETQKAVLIPTSDKDIDFIIKYADILSCYFIFQESYKNGLAQTLMDKGQFYEICKTHNIDHPQYLKCSKQGLKSKAKALNFPCLIKPSQISTVKSQMNGRKLWTVTNYVNYLYIISRLPGGDTDWIIQDIIEGPESDIFLYCGWIDKYGNIYQDFTAQKLRQFPPGFGSASLAISTPKPIIEQLSKSLCKAIKYTGIMAAEFKYDCKTKTFKIIEINPRPSLWFELSSVSGKKIALACYCDLLGLVRPKDRPQINNRLWRYTLKDIYSALFYSLRKDFILPKPQVKKSKRLKNTYAIFAKDDPLPAIFETKFLLGKFMKRLMRKPF